MLGVGAAACALLFGACSSNSACGDADCTDGGITGTDSGSDASGLFLSRGMNNYTVTGVANGNDGCMLQPDMLLNSTFPVNFVEATQTLSVGNDKGAPAMPSFGSGVVGTTGTLTRDNMVTDDTMTGCSWHQTDTSVFMLVGGDIFTLDVTEVEDMFNGCGTTAPTGGMCTSTFTITLAKAQ
jgi:hypothetical protein